VSDIKAKELKALRAALDAKYAKDVEAIEHVLRLFAAQPVRHGDAEWSGEPTTNLTVTFAHPLPVQRIHLPRVFSNMGFLRDTVSKLSGDFTLEDVSNALKASYPDRPVNPRSLSTMLSRLSKRGEIETVSPGYGHKRAVYRKKTLVRAGEPPSR